MHPKPKHTFEQLGPFLRVHVVVYGRSRTEAVERARDTRLRLSNQLPLDATCWAPVYQGVDAEVRRHQAAFIIAFAAHRDDLRSQVDSLVAGLS